MAKEDTRELLKFLEAYPASSREVALWLRNFVWELYPDCNELIYDNYNFLAFGWAPTDRMSDIFCNVAVGTRGVLFGFMRGVDLADPDDILSGSGNQFRSLRVPDTKSFPKKYVTKLVKQAYENSIVRLKGRPRESNGATIVKSISKKQRRPGMKKDEPQLRRERYPMPDLVLNAIEKANLFDAYESRPPYQQNDYIGWIIGAKREETREARLAQMLDELRRGDTYMKMDWPVKPPK